MWNVFAGNMGLFGVSCFSSPSSRPALIWPRPLSPLLLNITQTARLHNSRRPQLLTCVVRPTPSCQQIMSGRLFVFLCHLSTARDCIWTTANAGVRKSKSSMSLSPSPRCPVKFCYTAQMLHSRLGFQEIITDWKEQHPVAVGEPLPVFVWLPMLYKCPRVLAQG